MIMKPVISSNLVAVGYNPNSMILRIQFLNGTYDYYNVPNNVYQSLMNAGSKGSYHATFIKNVYPYIRIA